MNFDEIFWIPNKNHSGLWPGEFEELQVTYFQKIYSQSHLNQAYLHYTLKLILRQSLREEILPFLPEKTI